MEVRVPRVTEPDLTLEETVQLLVGLKITGFHNEWHEAGGGQSPVVSHNGYRVARCRCRRPIILGKTSADQGCGRQECAS